METDAIMLRDVVRPGDPAAVRTIVRSSGFFHDHEVEVAVELVEDWLSRGAASAYRFVLADVAGRPVGYTCYGEIACTVGSYDLYWIAVHADWRGRGLGRRLIAETEQRIAAAGGRRIYVETSARPQYEPTRRFYERCGYRAEAVLADFYAPGDGKVIFCKVLSA